MFLPGKTFLIGEYSVLKGGNALVLSTGPCFSVEKNNNSEQIFHPQSAAGLYLNKINSQSHSVIHNISSRGGFGESTAQFLAVWLEKNQTANLHSKSTIVKCYDDYVSLYEDQEDFKKMKPSGADLVSLLLGQVTFFSHQLMSSTRCLWNFSHLGFTIYSTGFKIPTHEHLLSLNKDKLSPLVDLSQKAIDCYMAGNEDSFFLLLKEWGFQLQNLGLQHANCLELKNKIELLSDKIKLVKLNGALGMDTFTVFYKVENQQFVDNVIQDYINKEKLQVKKVFTEKNLMNGVMNGI